MSESGDRRKTITELINMRVVALQVAEALNDDDLWQAANDGDNTYLLAFFEERRSEVQEHFDELGMKLKGVLSTLEIAITVRGLAEHKASLQYCDKLCQAFGSDTASEDELRGVSMAVLLRLRKNSQDDDQSGSV